MNIGQSYRMWSVTVKELKEEIDSISRLPEFERPLTQSVEEHERALSKIAYWRIIREKVVIMLVLTILIFAAVGLAGWSSIIEVSMPNLQKVATGIFLIYGLLFFITHIFYKSQLKKYHSN